MASVVEGLARLHLYSLYIHNLRENLDGAHNRGHKQTDPTIIDFAKAFDKAISKTSVRISWGIMVYEMISSRGSRLGYLGKHKKLSSMVLAQTLPVCCLVSPRVPY